METIFLNLLDMSVVGSYITIAILLARVLLQKSPKIFSYVLWSVVFFRLLCPFTMESPVSLLPEQTQGISFTRFSVDSSPSQQLAPENTDIAVKEPIIPVVDEPKVENTPVIQVEETKKESLSILQVSQILWVSGMLVISSYSLFSLLKLKNILKYAIYFEKNIYFADNIDGPFVFGLWKPKIYVPTYVDEDELSYIIAHEQEHIRRFDHVTRFLCHLALIMHWFNPFVWIAYHVSAKDMELSCDEAVLKEESVKIRGEYARILLKFSGDGSFVTPLAFSENNTKGRVKNIMKMKKSKLWVSGCAGILVLSLIVGFSTSKTSTLQTYADGFIKELELRYYEEVAYSTESDPLYEPYTYEFGVIKSSLALLHVILPEYFQEFGTPEFEWNENLLSRSTLKQVNDHVKQVFSMAEFNMIFYGMEDEKYISVTEVFPVNALAGLTEEKLNTLKSDSSLSNNPDLLVQTLLNSLDTPQKGTTREEYTIHYRMNYAIENGKWVGLQCSQESEQEVLALFNSIVYFPSFGAEKIETAVQTADNLVENISLDDFKKIQIGTSMEEVRETLGKPKYSYTYNSWLDEYDYEGTTIYIHYDSSVENFGLVTEVFSPDFDI